VKLGNLDFERGARKMIKRSEAAMEKENNKDTLNRAVEVSLNASLKKSMEY